MATRRSRLSSTTVPTVVGGCGDNNSKRSSRYCMEDGGPTIVVGDLVDIWGECGGGGGGFEFRCDSMIWCSSGVASLWSKLVSRLCCAAMGGGVGKGGGAVGEDGVLCRDGFGVYDVVFFSNLGGDAAWRNGSSCGGRGRKCWQ
ncbi:Hypothetical predicted protein [Olea europaea subsp. europaea]|uniref:Uncharacterized protein n=1 Tax=Olea europaea subsp. europaea TaxID=158383 RepID=A0A8S0QZC7_OLEEU|nr:Hypothetical predicted protein [Olea europaea subsp. europaea]